MLDLKKIRENPEIIQTLLNSREPYPKHDLKPILNYDRQQRELEVLRTELQTKSNEISKLIGQKIKNGLDPTVKEISNLREQGNSLKKKLFELEPEEKKIKEKLENLLLQLPNLPVSSAPIGKDETENIEVKSWGEEYLPKIQVLPHWEIAEKLGILEVEKAVKIARSRFVALFGVGAALERALISYMLDQHIASGYIEVMPPILVNSNALRGTGQLPKFAEESFFCREDDLWLSPTAEVPVMNLYSNEILEKEALSIRHCAFTPCFRREAGSYGKDTRGLIRLHQFNKVELVKIVHPKDSEIEHQRLVENVESILQNLKLPYRILELCTGDLGFGAAKCYDLEVWLPSSNSYREISSCSNCWDFQARRANIRFREKGQKGTKYVHSLNGSGLAVGRTMAAILENYQQADGTIKVPEVLQPYLKQDTL